MKILLVCSLLAVLCTATIIETSIPLFVWSNDQIFLQHNEQILQTLTTKDIEDSLQALLLGTERKTFIGEIKGTPEAVVIFVEPKLQTNEIPHFGSAYATSTNGGAFSSLKSIIESSKSSLVAPYVATSQYSLVDSLLARVAGKMTKGSVLIVSDEGSLPLFELADQSGVQATTSSELKGHSSLFTNGLPDLIIFCLSTAVTTEQLAAHDSFIGSFSQMISTATSGNFVGMYTGNSITSSDIKRTFPDPNAIFHRPANRYWEDIYVDVTYNTTNSTQPHTYFTGPMLEAFMVVIALLTMVFVGMCNLCNLQVPETYETPKAQIKM